MNDIQSAITAALQREFPPDQPGATVIVTRRGETLVRAGYGLAHLELGVAMQPHMVLRIGSITKQITSVAALLLLEQGKLALGDPVARFLPDYPAHAQAVTIEHLLTHTSGIPSYTD